MKTLVLLSLLISSTAFARVCTTDDVSGAWVNPYGVKFEIKEMNCNHLIVSNPGDPAYEIDLTGHRPTQFDADGLNFELKLKPESRRKVRGTMIWKIAPRLGFSAPGFGLAVEVRLTGEDEVPNGIQTKIVSFTYERGNLGNIFDEAMELAVGVLNRFHLTEVLSADFLPKNELFRRPN